MSALESEDALCLLKPLFISTTPALIKELNISPADVYQKKMQILIDVDIRDTLLYCICKQDVQSPLPVCMCLSDGQSHRPKTSVCGLQYRPTDLNCLIGKFLRTRLTISIKWVELLALGIIVCTNLVMNMQYTNHQNVLYQTQGVRDQASTIAICCCYQCRVPMRAFQCFPYHNARSVTPEYTYLCSSAT